MCIVSTMDTEIWKPCHGIYEVSNLGKVRNRRPYPKLMKQHLQKFSSGKPGYFKVFLTDPSAPKGRLVSVHRLVAMAFVSGYRPGLEVNHKDLNKLNNLPENLEWVTHSQNIRHGMASHPTWKNRMAKANRRIWRAVVGFDNDLGIKEWFPSLREAGRYFGNPQFAANIKHAIDTGSVSYSLFWRYASAIDFPSKTPITPHS